MNEEYAIRLINVKKQFRVYYDKGISLKEKVLFKSRNKYEERIVLDGINLSIKKGEAVGLIGKNGCGKSTTLKLINRIIYPDGGEIQINGRISSLIELGAGFHPDMTGRENIYTNAAIFGLKRKEIDQRLDKIIEFSELGEYIDNPVRTYSSGMYMRLAFSVAINVDADILLIDEILAVGDANFQAKCFNRLREIKASGTTIVIVSHSLSQIEQICDRSIWIHEGKIRAEGIPRDVHPQYLDFMGNKRQKVQKKKSDNTPQSEKTIAEKKRRWGNGKARISKISILDIDGQERTVFKMGEDIVFQLDYNVNEKVENAVVGIGIFRSDGLQCYGTNTRIDKMQEYDITQNGAVTLKLKNVNLLPGEYYIDFALEEDLGIPVDYYTRACKIDIYSEYDDVGVCRIEHSWDI